MDPYIQTDANALCETCIYIYIIMHVHVYTFTKFSITHDLNLFVHVHVHVRSFQFVGYCGENWSTYMYVPNTWLFQLNTFSYILVYSHKQPQNPAQNSIRSISTR